MGQVWEARDETLERLVAVKVIALLAGGGSRGDEARARFLREARITAALQHPNIVTVHDLGEAEGEDGRAPFLVMELLRGEGLDALLHRGGPVPLPDAARWGAQICDALSEAHRAGVLHRDIKPSNVLLGPSGTVKVLDFGIARAADPYATAGRLTQTGLIVGTPPYMAPEQARGHPETRSDLYALGCLLYELITGRLPFQAPDTVGYLTAHLTQEPAAPSTVAEGIPPAWDGVLLTLLRKDPDQRYATAADTAEALRALDRRAERPAPAPVVERIPTAVERTPTAVESAPGAVAGRPASPSVAASGPAVHANPRPGAWKLYGVLRRMAVAAVILTAWAVVVHLFKPEETWGFTGPDYFILFVAVAVCVGLEISAPWDLLTLDTDRLTVVRRSEARNKDTFSISWTALDRIAVIGEGRSAEVVVWFAPGEEPAPEWTRAHRIKRYGDGHGHVLCHPVQGVSPGSPKALLDRLREGLTRYAGAKHL